MIIYHMNPVGNKHAFMEKTWSMVQLLTSKHELGPAYQAKKTSYEMKRDLSFKWEFQA